MQANADVYLRLRVLLEEDEPIGHIRGESERSRTGDGDAERISGTRHNARESGRHQAESAG